MLLFYMMYVFENGYENNEIIGKVAITRRKVTISSGKVTITREKVTITLTKVTINMRSSP